MGMGFVIAGINGGALLTFLLCLVLDEIRIKYCLTDIDMIKYLIVFVFIIIGVSWLWLKFFEFILSKIDLAEINKKIEKNHKNDNVKLNKY